jgi:hypothetical protein
MKRRLALFGETTPLRAITKSADGVTWTAVADSRFSRSAIIAVAYGNGRFVAVGANGRIAYCDW